MDYSKLDIKDGDTVLLKGNIPPSHARILSENLRKKNDITVIILAGGQDLEILNEKEMNSCGWYRKEKL